MRLVRLAAAAGFVLLPGVPRSQSIPTLVGAATSQGVTSLVERDFLACSQRSCATLLPPGPGSAAHAGGATYDPRFSGVWLSDGANLGLFDPDTCMPLASPMPAPFPEVVTGLATMPSRGALFASGAPNVLYRLAQGTQPVVTGRWTLAAVPAGHVTGGVAADDLGDLLFVAASSFTAAVPDHRVYVVRGAAPDTVHCVLTVPACAGRALGAITGLAFDEAISFLWLTDGHRTLGCAFARGTCTLTAVSCCDLAGPRLGGLGVRPSRATAVGTSCAAGSCLPCRNAVAGTVGDPVLGNASFALRLSGVPVGQPGVLLVDTGPCQPPGTTVPALCGPILVPLSAALAVVGPFTSLGSGGCDGSISVRLPIPVDPRIVGIGLASQFVVFCPAAGTGTVVSHGLNWLVWGT
ncbi:MAG: hypothetical protein IT458_13000 [Planctomycetes bacterium]|nr:hypothetical protein [Planctomycetota bacterium]